MQSRTKRVNFYKKLDISNLGKLDIVILVCGLVSFVTLATLFFPWSFLPQSLFNSIGPGMILLLALWLPGPFIAFAGAILALVGIVLYVRDIFRSKHPHLIRLSISITTITLAACMFIPVSYGSAAYSTSYSLGGMTLGMIFPSLKDTKQTKSITYSPYEDAKKQIYSCNVAYIRYDYTLNANTGVETPDMTTIWVSFVRPVKGFPDDLIYIKSSYKKMMLNDLARSGCGFTQKAIKDLDETSKPAGGI